MCICVCLKGGGVLTGKAYDSTPSKRAALLSNPNLYTQDATFKHRRKSEHLCHHLTEKTRG